ncbi:MAG: HD domain-containing phosphohydrolase [Leptospirales bacterium]
MKGMEEKENQKSTHLEIDLKQVVYALSDALDFVGVDEVHHGKRVGYMVLQCAKLMGLSDEESQLLFETGLLHDCGVSSTRVHKHLISEFDWSNSMIHCEVGYELLKNFEPWRPMALPIRYHHTHWEKLRDVDIDEKTRQFANLIYLADRVDISSAAYYGKDILVKKEEVRKSITEKAGTFFSKELNDVFWEAADKQAFWLMLTPGHITSFMSEIRKKTRPNLVSYTDLKHVAQIFSQIVDAKSPFTMEHSAGVARMSRFLAEELCLGENILDKIEIAGLLHDLGKLKIPDVILEKEGPLNENERAVIEEHSFETFEILNKITGLEDVARWAAYHHERPDGKGYPFQVHIGGLEVESRIIAAADVFQALIQERPYRKALAIREILIILREMAQSNSLDALIVNLIEKRVPACYEAALPVAD